MGDGAGTGSAVDAAAVYGIASRIQELFSATGSFLAFPLAPVPYAVDELRFLAPGGLSSEQAQAAAEFALLVNQVPTVDPTWTPDPAGGYIWDIYKAVLGAELAESNRTADEEEHFQKAWRYLHADEEGDPPSAEYLRYQAAQQIYFNAQAAYAQAEGSPDAGRLRALRDAALDEWRLFGHKDEVEAALSDVARLGDKDPGVTWNSYRTTFDPGDRTSFQTAPGGTLFAPTSFAPSNALDLPWPRMTMTRADIQAGASKGPGELAALLADQAASVESVSFDYLMADVVRPWLSDAMFSSKAWRFGQGQKPLSDGGDPPQGRCPAYVARVIFARNVAVTRKAAPTEAQPPPSLGFIEPVVHLPLAELRVARVAASLKTAKAKELIAATGPDSARTTASVARSAIATTHMASALHLDPDMVMARASGSEEVRAEASPEPQAETPAIAPAALRLLARNDFSILPMISDIATAQTAPTPPPEGLETTVTPPDTVLLMAFACRVLPRAPDPDWMLSWPGEVVLPWPGRVLEQPPAIKGDDVRDWQTQMKARGWSISVDGNYDERDEAVCRKFQAEKGLDVDGRVGRETWRAAWVAPVT
jgi:Putative peptidoglycan binding domain